MRRRAGFSPIQAQYAGQNQNQPGPPPSQQQHVPHHGPPSQGHPASQPAYHQDQYTPQGVPPPPQIQGAPQSGGIYGQPQPDPYYDPNSDPQYDQYQNGGYPQDQNGGYQDQNGYPQEQYSNYDPYTDNDSISFQSQQSYDGRVPHWQQPIPDMPTLPPEPHGPDYISMNKKFLKNPPPKSYKKMYGRRKETENKPEFVPQGKKQTPVWRADIKNSHKAPGGPAQTGPLKPIGNNAQNQNQDFKPMSAEEFWRNRAANLENRKSGGGKSNKQNTRKYPSAGKVSEPHPPPPHQNNQYQEQPYGAPVQNMYQEDVNLKLVSPPPPQGYAARPAPQHTYGYAGQAGANQFTYRAPGYQQSTQHTGRPAWQNQV